MCDSKTRSGPAQPASAKWCSSRTRRRTGYHPGSDVPLWLTAENEIERIAIEHGLTHLETVSSITAVPFYSALGYEIIEQRRARAADRQMHGVREDAKKSCSAIGARHVLSKLALCRAGALAQR